MSDSRTDLEREVVELRARVAQLQDDLAAANQELEALAHSVSHDLRAPLRAVQGFSQIALDECGDALAGNGREYLTRVTSASRRMSSQIDSLLKLSKVGRAPMQRVPLDVSALTLEVWRRLKQAEPARDVPLTVVDGLRATADRRLLETALEQLLDNARKFTARTLLPEVEVGVDEIEGEPAFFVRDNGAGFEQAYAGRLFAPFQRLHSDRDFPGLGIGLAIVHRVVRRHGGRVWATGAPGAGATILFTLPEPWPAR